MKSDPNIGTTACPTCGLALFPDVAAGQCPRCLLGMASQAEDDPGLADFGFQPARRQFSGYVLGRQVGAGGMGVVYEAQRLADGRKVAIKLIREFYMASPTLLRRFTIEAEAAARLDHPQIVRIHEVGECEGQPFFSMDFIEGESLNAKMAQGNLPLAHPQIAELMARVARAVHHAHERGVLHRDLKPANILIDPQGAPHLTDFGLAKILQPGSDEGGPHTLTGSGDAPGTPSFMSPEQVSGAEIGCAADIYGLGAVLYALLTGRPPFQGATPLELFRQIIDHPPARPRALIPSIPPDLETICLKCLEKDPRHRYSTAQALAEDLENFAAGRPIQARPAGPGHRTWHWIKRNRFGTALILSLCLGLSVALALLKAVDNKRREIASDRDQAFDDGMQKISSIWREPATRAVTISARELAILAGRSPLSLVHAQHQFILGVSADQQPSAMAKRYGRLLGSLQAKMQAELGDSVVFHLRLLKRFNQNDQTLVAREVDFLVLSAVDFLHAQQSAPGITPVARANISREAVIFAHTNSGIQRMTDLRGHTMAFPDPDLSPTVWAKARLAQAGLRAKDFRSLTNLVNENAESGTITSIAETVERVLRREADAGVTHRARFERYRHLGLTMLDHFPETPNVLAAREGLDPKLVQALRNVIRSLETSRIWPENKFVAEPAAAHSSAPSMLLEDLRSAMRQAEQFDQPPPAGPR